MKTAAVSFVWRHKHDLHGVGSIIRGDSICSDQYVCGWSYRIIIVSNNIMADQDRCIRLAITVLQHILNDIYHFLDSRYISVDILDSWIVSMEFVY